MTVTMENVQADWIASLKSKSEIYAFLSSGTNQEIRECEYQSDKFSYPNIRVGVDFKPSIEGCGPDDADVYIEIFSDEKSSKKVLHIAGLVQTAYHKQPFTINGRRYSTVVVRRHLSPDRSILAWVVKVPIFVQVAG